MTLARLRPDSLYYNDWPVRPIGWIQLTAAQVLRDDNDFTYILGEVQNQLCRLTFNGFRTFTLPPGAVVRSITPIVRAAVDDPADSAYFYYQLLIADQDTVGADYISPNFDHQLGDEEPDNLFLTGLTGNLSQQQIDDLGLKLNSGFVTGNTHACLLEVYCDVRYVPPPTTVVTGPTGTLRINNPTITWAHQPGADAPGGQTKYRVIVYDNATNGIVWDTGDIASAASSAVVGPLALAHTYVAYVYTAQETDGIEQWTSSVTPTTFTLDVNGPTVDVTGPTGIQGTTSPTLTWTHTPGAGAQTGQTLYRITGYAQDDPTRVLYDTGEVASSAQSAVLGPLRADIAWRFYVTTAQTTYGVPQWSAADFTDFTIDVTVSRIDTVVIGKTDDQRGGIPLTITRITTDPLWQFLDVEATYDGGTTWLPVRGATRLAVNGDVAYVTDYEAPNDTLVQYRARATRISAGVAITSNWIASAPTTWHLAGNEVFLKDPDHPERNVRVCLSQLPEPAFGRTVGVFRPVGASFPVVVSDVLQAPTFVIGIVTRTLADSEALLTVLQAPVILFQSPLLAWGWRSEYVALGPVTQARTRPTSVTGTRVWSVAMTVVARPADETAT